MTRKLNPFHQQLWRSNNSIQLGLGDSAVVLEAVTANQQRFINALQHGFAESQVEAIANQVKLPYLQAQELLAKLDGLLLEDSPALAENLDWNQATVQVVDQSPELVRASLDRSALGQAVLRERANRSVLITSGDITSHVLVQLLAQSGVGQIWVRPSVRSAMLDTGIGVGVIKNLDQARASTLRAVDLVLHSGQQVIDPRTYRHWIGMGLAQLGIAFQPTGVTVSAVRRPLENGCLRCEHLENCDADPEWGVLAAQLLTSQLRFDDTSTRSVAAGLASHQSLRWLDQQGGFSGSVPPEDYGYRFSSVSGSVTRLEQRRHPECDCLELAKQLKVA